MDTLFPTMLERPGGKTLVNTYLYWLFGFWFVSFMMRGLLMDAWDNVAQRVLFAVIQHVLHFAAAVLLYRKYLAEAFFTLRIYTKKILKTAAICIGLMCAVAGLVFLLGVALQTEVVMVALRGMLPLPLNDTMLLSGDMLLFDMGLGFLSMVILAPTAICCLLYAPSFAVACCKHPVAAYGVMAAALVFSRLLNASTTLGEDLTLCFAQLPLHMIAYWGYQKTECIWTPILSVTGMNLLASAALVLIRNFVL